MLSLFRSARTLRRYWKITAISVFSLSVAIALAVIALSISNTVLLLPPSGSEPDRLVMLYSHAAGEDFGQISYPDYVYIRDHNHVFTNVSAAPNSIGFSENIDDNGHETKVANRPVSDNYFDVLGIHPFLGRFFAPGDDRSGVNSGVMTWSCWKRLGSDPHIVGKSIAGHTILGVAPPEFTGSLFGVNGDLLVNFDTGDRGWFNERGTRHLFLTARLKPGVTREQAQAEVTMLAGQLASAYPAADKGRTATVTRATLLTPDAIPDLLWMTGILIGLVLLVLLIACANVANLLLAAAVGRRQEAAIKLAIGAPRGRLIREFLGESILLCAISGVLGYALALAVAARFSDFSVVFPMVGALAFSVKLHFGGAVLGSTLALILVASLTTGLAPAFYASAPSLSKMLGGELAVGGTRKHAWRNALVIVQVAVCTFVLVGMGLAQRDLYNLRNADLGFSSRRLMAVNVYLHAENYDEERGKLFYTTLRQTTAALPGVQSVTLAQDLPLFGSGGPVPVQIAGEPKPAFVNRTIVDDAYFSTLGLRLLSGRAFNESDREGAPLAVIINRKMADTFWPGKDPQGRIIAAGKPARSFTIVGVAANSKYEDIDEATKPFMYFALRQNYSQQIYVMARTARDPKIFLPEFRKALRGLGLRVMIEPITFAQWIDLDLFGQRVAASGVAILSGLALILAIIGLAGAVSYSVGERKKELGIRVALGASPWQLLQMVLRQTGVVVGAGVIAGIFLGIAGSVALRSELYQIGAIEWIVLIPVGLAMLALSLLIAYLSARPWLSTDPMEAVRHA